MYHTQRFNSVQIVNIDFTKSLEYTINICSSVVRMGQYPKLNSEVSQNPFVFAFYAALQLDDSPKNTVWVRRVNALFHLFNQISLRIQRPF